jgi:tRNA 2-selenouridine synthase
MRAGTCLNLVLPDVERVALLMEDYDFFVRDTEAFCERLNALTPMRGKAVVEGWQAQVRAGQIEPVVQALLTLHYDPVYISSMARNFKHYDTAKLIAPHARSTEAMGQLATEIISSM